MYMESELPQEPAPLVFFELNAEFKLGTGGKLKLRTRQLVEASLNCCKLRNPFVRAPDPATINFRER